MGSVSSRRVAGCWHALLRLLVVAVVLLLAAPAAEADTSQGLGRALLQASVNQTANGSGGTRCAAASTDPHDMQSTSFAS